MHPLIEKNRAAIENLCRLHGVRRLEVFGSILRDDFNDDRSDVDVLVEFGLDRQQFLQLSGPERVLGGCRRSLCRPG